MKTRHKIYIIGSGGVGSWLLPSMCLLERPSAVVAVDGDRLEEKNLNRQLFTSDDLGRFKSESLARKYGCEAQNVWFSAGMLPVKRPDWLMVCVDNHRARREALFECDQKGCSAIFAANETHSSEAFVYLPIWKETHLDPRVYYPEIVTDDSNDPTAMAIGCTGVAQQQNTQLVSANFTAAALAQHLYVAWAMELPKMDDQSSVISFMPYKLTANMTRLETRRVGDTSERIEQHENICGVS